MAYSRKQWVLAVNLAAVVGWAAFQLSNLLEGGPASLLRNGSQVIAMLPLTAVIGLPIALGACWLIAAPILRRLMRRPITWPRAALWGLIVPAAMAAVGVLIWRLCGLWAHFSPGYSQAGGGAQIIEIDGILTPYGWWATLRGNLIFVAAGFCVALIVRAIIGPGAAPAKSPEAS